MKKLLLVAIGLSFFISCKETPKSDHKKEEIVQKNASFNSLLEDYYQEGLKLYPLNATFQGDPRYNAIFPNNLSTEFRAKESTYYNNYQKELSKYKDSSLTAEDALSLGILEWECERNLERLSFREDVLPLDQMWTPQLMMGQLAGGTAAQPFNTVKDYENWLSRLIAYTEWLTTAEEKMKEGVTLGIALPKSLIKKVVPQLAAVAEADLESHLFMTPVYNFPSEFSTEDKDRLKKEYTNMVTNQLIPAYKSIQEFMAGPYMEAGRTTSGIGALTYGKSYYDYSIKLYTTTDLTADEIHTMGLNEVARISAEMEKIKEEVGFTGDLKAFFDHVRNRKELMPFKNPQEVIDNFNAIHEKMKPQINSLFDKMPITPFEVRRTEAFREASASAEYNSGSIDGTRPGIFYVPIPDVSTYNMYSDEDLFLHEAIPGHHFQTSLTQENTDLPKFRKTLWYSAYGEGWALYTESLGKELGLYTDPYQYFGMLGAEMHRAVRLVVDTGLHSKEWTREQAITYSLENEAESEAGITSEIERYMANPGQALSYKIGQLKIRELRALAEKEMGTAFNIKEFHNQVLETGCVPLALLEKKIKDWIATSK